MKKHPAYGYTDCDYPHQVPVWVNFTKPAVCSCGLIHKGATVAETVELYWFNCSCDSTLTVEKSNATFAPR